MRHRLDATPAPTCTTTDVVHDQPPGASYQPRP